MSVNRRLENQFLAAPALIYMDLIVKPECLSKFVLTQPRGTHVTHPRGNPSWLTRGTLSLPGGALGPHLLLFRNAT